MPIWRILALAGCCLAFLDARGGETAASEAFLKAARDAYGTPAYASYTNTLVKNFLPAKTVRADVPVEGGSILWKEVEGMRNVRDLGGWTGLATERVFRGSEPDCLPPEKALKKPKGKYHDLNVTPKGLQTIRGDLKIKTDLDLRAASECPHPETSAFGGNVNLVRIPLSAYEKAFTQTNEYARALRVFADPANYPVYFHCWGGADRTGTIALLLEGLCGVSETDCAIDYELTSFAAVFGTRTRVEGHSFFKIASVIKKLKTYPGATFADQIESYMKTTLGLSSDEIDRIRRQLMTR